MPSLKIPAHDGGAFEAYIALPENTPAPAIIVIQEIFGVNAEMREKCDALARQGYIAVCPDLFWRIAPGIQLVDSVEEELQYAFELFGQFDVVNGVEDLKTTLGFMRNHKNCNKKVGCMGFCLGGKLAYMMASATDINASVSYYGVGIEAMLDRAAKIKTPLLMHIAEEDKFVSKDAQKQIKHALAHHPMVTIFSYPGAEHAFARGQGMHYHAESAQAAQQRTSEFLAKSLNG